MYFADGVSLAALQKAVKAEVTQHAEAMISGAAPTSLSDVMKARGIIQGLRMAIEIAERLEAENRKKQED